MKKFILELTMEELTQINCALYEVEKDFKKRYEDFTEYYKNSKDIRTKEIKERNFNDMNKTKKLNKNILEQMCNIKNENLTTEIYESYKTINNK